MSLLPLADWIERTPLGVTMSNSRLLFPVILIAHIIGLALFVGTILIADLNLLGIGMRRQHVSEIARQLLPVTLAGLAVALISGPFLFVPQAVKCYGSPFFRIKMLLLLLALAFHFTIHRRAMAPGEPGITPVSRKLIACVSLMLWISVGVAGQAIGLLGRTPNNVKKRYAFSMRTSVVLLLLSLFGMRTVIAQTLSPAAPAPAASKTAAPASNEDRARGLLDESLKDRNPDTRKQAAQALSLAGAHEPYLSMLTAMLNDKDVQVRVAAVSSLGDLKSPTTVAGLQKLLDDNVPEVSFAAAKALWTLGEPSGKEALVSILSGETKTSSGFLTQQKRDALRMLYTPKPLFMFAMKAGAGFAPVPGMGTGISSLQGILSDPGVSGRAATALLLSADKDPKVLAALEDALVDKNWSVRAAAVHAIALRNDPALEKDMIPGFDDKNEAVRLRAAAGFLRLEYIRSTTPKPKPAPKRTSKKAAPASSAANTTKK